jgi:hypothetical protein
MHTAFNLPYVYDYITKLCRKQAEVIRNHENEHVRDIGQGEARHRIIIVLNLEVVKIMTLQVTSQTLQHKICKIAIIMQKQEFVL